MTWAIFQQCPLLQTFMLFVGISDNYRHLPTIIVAIPGFGHVLKFKLKQKLI